MTKLDRREFISMVGVSVAASISDRNFADIQGECGGELVKNGWRLQVTPEGEIVSFADSSSELINRRLPNNRPRLLISGRRRYVCEGPSVARRDGEALIFQYDFAGEDKFSVHYKIELQDLAAGVITLKQTVGLHASPKIGFTVELTLPRNIQLPSENRKVFVPLKNGIGRHKPIEGYESENEYVYPMAGGTRAMGKPQLLAIPMVDEYADGSDLRLTHTTDPYFSTYFFLAHGDKTGRFNCTYAVQVGVENEERMIYTTVHRGDEKTAMQVFYATSVADVKPGPDWLHDVAMVDYDYLSKNGQGWFRDIDALAARTAPQIAVRSFSLCTDGTTTWAGTLSTGTRTLLTSSGQRSRVRSVRRCRLWRMSRPLKVESAGPLLPSRRCGLCRCRLPTCIGESVTRRIKASGLAFTMPTEPTAARV